MPTGGNIKTQGFFSAAGSGALHINEENISEAVNLTSSAKKGEQMESQEWLWKNLCMA